jgi:hypothetical protein
MRLVMVRLDSLDDGAVIRSDIVDSLGRLLLKAPKELDPITKKILLHRGISEVVVEDTREQKQVEDVRDIDQEISLLEKRLLRLLESPAGEDFREVVLETVRDFYVKNHRLS